MSTSPKDEAPAPKRARQTDKTVAECYFDGASKGNPGHASYGWVIKISDSDSATEYCGSAYLGDDKTNNEAEYEGVISLLGALATTGVDEAVVRGDSMLVVNQINGKWECKKPHIKMLRNRAVSALNKIKFRVRFERVPRAENAHADELANQAIKMREKFKREPQMHVIGDLRKPRIDEE